jgi:hypothetical protein
VLLYSLLVHRTSIHVETDQEIDRFLSHASYKYETDTGHCYALRQVSRQSTQSNAKITSSRRATSGRDHVQLHDTLEDAVGLRSIERPGDILLSSGPLSSYEFYVLSSEVEDTPEARYRRNTGSGLAIDGTLLLYYVTLDGCFSYNQQTLTTSMQRKTQH